MNIAILLSGGTGTRLGADIPKQYIRVADRMIVTYSLKTLLEHPQIDGVLIVAEDEWKDLILQDMRKQYGQNRISQNIGDYKGNMKKTIAFAAPGVTRQFSILNALNCIKYEWNIETENVNVLIHDAARPNLSFNMISQCMDALNEHEGVMPVLLMKDTIYESKDGTRITNLLDRSKLFAGQAPEAFRFDLYYEANKKLLPDRLYQVNGSTEPAILAGMDVFMIAGDEKNYKITTVTDLKKFEQER